MQPQMEQRSPPQRQLQPAKEAAQKQREMQQQETRAQRREPEQQIHVPAAVVLGQVLAQTNVSPAAIKVGAESPAGFGWAAEPSNVRGIVGCSQYRNARLSRAAALVFTTCACRPIWLGGMAWRQRRKATSGS